MHRCLRDREIGESRVVFDHAELEDVFQTCIDGFLAVVKISACHHLEDVLDDLVVSLCKFTTLLNPSSVEEPVLAFGDELLRSLQLVLKLDAHVVDAYCEQITQEVSRLVKANASHIRSQMGWRTITSLLSITARHPEASEAGFDALLFIMSDGAHLLPANYVLCVDAARQFAKSRIGQADRSLRSLDLMSGSVGCLRQWAQEAKEAMGEAEAAKTCQDIGEMWLRLVQGLRKVCLDQREEVRNHALFALQMCLTGVDEVHIQHTLWLQCFDLVIATKRRMREIAAETERESFTLLDFRGLGNQGVLSLKTNYP